MSELDQAELKNFEGLKLELERANQTGLNQKIPFLDYYKANVDNHINALQPNGVSLDTEDERKRKSEGANVAVAVAQQHQREISSFAEHGFQSSEQFLDFSEKFKDKNFMATLDALPEEDKKKLADKMAEQYNSMSPEDRRKTTPEAVNWIQEHSDIKLLGSNKQVEALRESVVDLAGGERGNQLVDGTKANNTRYNEFIDINANATTISNTEAEVKEDRRMARTELATTVHAAAEERGVANHQADVRSTMEGLSAEGEDLFASQPDIASVAKQLQKSGMNEQELASNQSSEAAMKDVSKPLQEAGMETDTATAASKPTDVELAANNSKDLGNSLT